MRHFAVALVLLFLGCGGSGGQNSELFGPGGASTADPTNTSTGGGTDGGGGSDGGTTTTTDAGGCSNPTTWYRDRDGDGFGGAETQSSCSSPGKEWVTKSGDCNDNDPNVFPGQTKFFTQGYSRQNTTSFDYDCSGAEEQQSAGFVKATNCTVVNQLCTGTGRLPAQPGRTGPGVDPYCGSTRAVTCAFNNQLQCVGTLRNDAEPLPCH